MTGALPGRGAGGQEPSPGRRVQDLSDALPAEIVSGRTTAPRGSQPLEQMLKTEPPRLPGSSFLRPPEAKPKLTQMEGSGHPSSEGTPPDQKHLHSMMRTHAEAPSFPDLRVSYIFLMDIS